MATKTPATTKTTKKETKVTTKTVTKKKDKKQKARSPLVNAILNTLTPKRWTGRDDLVEAVKKFIPDEVALKACDERIPVARTAPRAERIRRGQAMQVMLTCITLFQYAKIEQEGRGDTKKYRLAPPKQK